MNTWRLLPDLLAQADVVLVTVAATQGSAPREAGTSMLVSLTHCVDTIGGGHLEWEAIAQARAMLLQAEAAPALQRLSLGASLGQCCGGVVWLVFERIAVAQRAEWMARYMALESGSGVMRELRAGEKASQWRAAASERHSRPSTGSGQAGLCPSGNPATVSASAKSHWIPAYAGMTDLGSGAVHLHQSGASKWRLLQRISLPHFPVTLFGAGHVGAAIEQVLAPLGAQIRWVDQREDLFGAPPGNVECMVSDAPEEAVASAPAGSYFLVLTHSHALDLVLSEHILRRGDFAWFGLIGSRTKRVRFEHRLQSQGLDCTRMTCPIGIPGITDKSPQAIAIAVVAQVLQVREQRRVPPALDDQPATSRRGFVPHADTTD